SLIVKSEIKTVGDLVGKRVAISRLGAIPHFTLQAIFNLYNVQGVNVVQTGTTTQAITSLSQGLVDGIITSAPFTFRLMKDGYRELVGPKDSTVSPVSIQPIVQQSAQWNLVDAKLASSTPLSAYYDNSYVEEIKRSGFLSELWR